MFADNIIDTLLVDVKKYNIYNIENSIHMEYTSMRTNQHCQRLMRLLLREYRQEIFGSLLISFDVLVLTSIDVSYLSNVLYILFEQSKIRDGGNESINTYEKEEEISEEANFVTQTTGTSLRS